MTSSYYRRASGSSTGVSKQSKRKFNKDLFPFWIEVLKFRFTTCHPMWLWLALHRCYLEVGALQCIGGFDTIAIKFVEYNPEQASFLLTCSILTSGLFLWIIVYWPIVNYILLTKSEIDNEGSNGQVDNCSVFGLTPQEVRYLKVLFHEPPLLWVAEDHRYFPTLTWLYNLDVRPQTDPMLSFFELFLLQSLTWSW